MIERRHVRRVVLSGEDRALCETNARAAIVGGRSHIRQGGDRWDKMWEDQLSGQYGQCALSIYLTGDSALYQEARRIANLHPTQGDGGCDLPGLNADVKCSRWRYAGKSPLTYHLWIRPAEFHPEHLYMLAVWEERQGNIVVYLLGWAESADLPAQPDADGRYSLVATDLSPLPRLVWNKPWQ